MVSRAALVNFESMIAMADDGFTGEAEVGGKKHTKAAAGLVVKRLS